MAYGGKGFMVCAEDNEPDGYSPQGELMAVMTGYFDESGKFQNQDVVSFCGFVSDPHGWEGFKIDWSRLLRRHNLQSVHFSKRKKHETVKGDAATRSSIYSEFSSCIKRNVEYGFGVSINAKAFREALSEKQRKRIKGDPHFLAFEIAISQILKYITDPKDSLSLVCDDDKEKAIEVYRLYSRLLQRSEPVRNLMRSICFADDKWFPQLQAADFFAWLMRAESERRFLGVEHGCGQVVEEFLRPSNDARIRIESVFWGESDLLRLAAAKHGDRFEMPK